MKFSQLDHIYCAQASMLNAIIYFKIHKQLQLTFKFAFSILALAEILL